MSVPLRIGDDIEDSTESRNGATLAPFIPSGPHGASSSMPAFDEA